MDTGGAVLKSEKVRLQYADGRVRALELVRCEDPVRRMVGMLRERQPDPTKVFRIAPCSSIHTCFMAFAIDVVFTDDSGRVLKKGRVAPWRLFTCSRASAVYEGVNLLDGEFPLERVEVEY